MPERTFTRNDPQTGEPMPLTFSYDIVNGIVVIDAYYVVADGRVAMQTAALPFEVIQWIAQEIE